LATVRLGLKLLAQSREKFQQWVQKIGKGKLVSQHLFSLFYFDLGVLLSLHSFLLPVTYHFLKFLLKPLPNKVLPQHQ
jgi:hypothetical protein